jgi:hypothetical protein
MLHTTFRKLIDDALRAQPFVAHTPIGYQEPVAMIPQAIAKGMMVLLKTEDLPTLFDNDGELIRVPNGAPAATTVRLEAGVVAASRVAAAGTHVIVYPEQSRALAVGSVGDIVLENKPGSFRTIEAAQFSTVSDDADVPVSPMPVNAAGIDWSQAVAKGLRIEFPRRSRKDVDADLLCAEIVAALTLGLGRAADQVLLSEIAATLPAPFKLANIAAQGLKFGELRGLIGTAGNGAQVVQDGTLRAAGIASELTADTAVTIVGAWNRAAVAIHEAVEVHFERISKKGDLAVTAWAHLLPLVPDSSKFWIVEAAL